MKYARLVPVLLFSLAACGDDDGGGRPIIVDGGNTTADAAPATCLLPASLGAVTPSQQEGHSAMGKMSTTVDNYYLYADLNTDAQPDVLLLDLYDGYGAFAGGFPTTATTVLLTGDETSYDSCGACVMALTDYTMSGPTGDPYFAQGGMLNLTSVSATSIAGTLNNVSFTHVTIDDQNVTTPKGDGCDSTLTSLSFSAVPEPDALVGGGTRWRLKLGKPGSR